MHEEADKREYLPVKPMRVPSKYLAQGGRNANTATIAEEDRDDEDAAQHGDAGASGAGPCVAGEFCAALDIVHCSTHSER